MDSVFQGNYGGKFLSLSFKFPPQTLTNFICFWMFFTFSLPIKAIPPLNYVSRKKPWAWTKMRENNPVLRVSMLKESIVCVTHTMHET